MHEKNTPPIHRAKRSRLVCRVANWLFDRAGWNLVGTIPEEKKLILVIGPHTSNWDFVFGALAMLALDIRLHFLAKQSLFFRPMGFLMKALGGIPVNRSRPEGIAEETASLVRQSEVLILAITPEGTRSKVEKLKTGFSRIAHEVPCPLVPVLFDFGNREIRLLAARRAGLPEEDAMELRKLFASVTPKNPSNF